MKAANYSPQHPVNKYAKYHAHVYYSNTTYELAQALCQTAAFQFNLPMGYMHQKPVGPHPVWSCQLSFTKDDFPELIAWLEENRGDLDILVHAVTGDDLADHTEHAYWLGNSHSLKLSLFS
ncbi:MAG: DOPA 4,5-dioxygenase family protein [Arenicella sp.]